MNRPSELVRYSAILLAFTSILSSPRGFSQDATPPSATAPAKVALNQYSETSISVGAAAQLTASRITETSKSLITQSLTPSAGLLAAFRQSFSPWLGYSVNLGYTRATYRYTDAPSASATGTTVETYIPNDIYETSVSYIAQRHLTPAFTVFGEAGAGAIAFAARSYEVHSTPAIFSLNFRNNTFRPEGIAGVGIDYRLPHGLGLRAEYRGLFAKYPDYASGTVRPTTIVSEPTLSITYALGGRHNR